MKKDSRYPYERTIAVGAQFIVAPQRLPRAEVARQIACDVELSL